MLRQSLVVSVAIVMLVGSSPSTAQRQRPLTPLPADGLRVAPFFDGWYENPDGTITLSFGYSNLNRTDVVEIPLGSDNFIQPKEYDGRQPTSFPPVVPTAGGDGSGAPTGGDRRQRERGVFTVTVPAGFRGDVVWTLRYQGQTYSVPGRARVGAYRLQWPMAMGSVPPLLRFSPTGQSGRGPMGIQADPQRIPVGAPLSLAVWTNDDSEREPEPVPIKQRAGEKAAINVSWSKHSGPGDVVFTPPRTPIAELQGTATTSAVFKQPGEYVIRVRVDNFGRVDTSPGNQCCWTNGYVRVTVTP
ncbi:MAG TPA: hypothetical protein VFB92_12505 [Vicinamibacterales bacterium]|nr:hypothetical protein [Vicinamibacterales bacterium]